MLTFATRLATHLTPSAEHAITETSGAEIISVEISYLFQLKIFRTAQKIFLQLGGRLASGFPLVSTNCCPPGGEFLLFEVEAGLLLLLLLLIEDLRKMSIKHSLLFKITERYLSLSFSNLNYVGIPSACFPDS